MPYLVFIWFYVFSTFSGSALGITTKAIPLIFANNSDSSQYVQIRSNVNHGSRNPLHSSHKNSLSPAQQTHILDDVQKNQRIHYHSGGPVNLDDRQKSLFGSQAQTSPQSLFDQSHLKYANYLNLNSLSPPPIQTVVLSPQQTLPTTAPHTDHSSYFRPLTHSDTKSTFSRSHSLNGISQIEPLNLPQEHQIIQELNPSRKTHYYQLPVPTNAGHVKSYVTTPSSQFPSFAKSDPINAYSLPATSSSKPNKTSTYSHLLGAPASSYQDKIIKEIVIESNPEELIAKDRQKFFQQLLEENKSSDDLLLQNADDQTVAQNDLSALKGQFESELLRQLGGNSVTVAHMPDLGLLINSSNAISEFSLPDGQKIQISKDYNRLLANKDGGKIKALVVKQQHPTTTSSPNILEELTKGVIPPGTDFEVIKRNKDGDLEVGKLPANLPQKKVTFVILEEQSDGSVRVQGVRGSEKESLQESGEEVDTIIRKIKEGELQLPPSTRLSSKPSQKSSSADKAKNNRSRLDEETISKRKVSSSDNAVKSLKRKEPHQEKHFEPTPLVQSTTTAATLTRTFFTPTSPTSGSSYQIISSPTTYLQTDNSALSSTPSIVTSNFESYNSIDTEPWNFAHQATVASPTYDLTTRQTFADNYSLFHLNNSGYISNLFSILKNPSSKLPVESIDQNFFQYPLLPTTSGSRVVEKVRGHNRLNMTAKGPQDQSTFVTNSLTIPSTTERSRENFTFGAYNKLKRDKIVTRKTTKKPNKDVKKDNEEEESTVEITKSEEAVGSSNSTLSDILKKEGFFAMARFLRQSGLDSILNDTGPFTLFIPTDKAFRTLLIQLGGPDKAEEKFRENPRLLSGLLLHHVIPGAFRVNSLQDEMTGVSLAGTQLRVNTYTTHDIEWNDITVVTVNGAKVLDEKDIVIPQGIAHAIDRVMFPLPVGNLLQSLQADRENRYSNFLKILEESELSYLLTGAKTFTLFAPLNRAFTHAEFTKIVSDPNESKSFVLRHLVPGALYSAGMKYYQVRDSMEDGQQVTLYKEAGKIKVNSAHVITRNIPSTNGIIHAIDAFL